MWNINTCIAGQATSLRRWWSLNYVPGGYVFELKVLFFSSLLGPPFLISKLITSSQLLQAEAEKRKFVGYRHISHICVTLLVWKKFRCRKGAEHTNTDVYLLMNAAVSQAQDRAAKTNKCSWNESVPCGTAHLQHSHVVLSKEVYHNTNHSWLGLWDRQELLGTPTSAAGMSPAVPVPRAVQHEGCLEFLAGGTGTALQQGQQPLPPSSATTQHACLPPSCSWVFPRVFQGCFLHPRKCISTASFCSSQPPSLATSFSPSGHFYPLTCSEDKSFTTKLIV